VYACCMGVRHASSTLNHPPVPYTHSRGGQTRIFVNGKIPGYVCFINVEKTVT